MIVGADKSTELWRPLFFLSLSFSFSPLSLLSLCHSLFFFLQTFIVSSFYLLNPSVFFIFYLLYSFSLSFIVLLSPTLRCVFVLSFSLSLNFSPLSPSHCVCLVIKRLVMYCCCCYCCCL